VLKGGKMVETDAGPPPIDPATYCEDYVDFTFDCGIATGDDALRASTVAYCLQGLSPYNEALIACFVKVRDDEDQPRACADYQRCAHAPTSMDAGRR
jgi:hypothetical protein